MHNPEIGINPNLTQLELNKLLRSTTTRIRRCISIKEAALKKIKENNREDREYGFKHLNFIINLQLRSYPRYIENIQIFLSRVNDILRKINILQPLNAGMLESASFNHAKNKLGRNITRTIEKFNHIKRQTSEIYNLVEGQRALLKPNMSGNEEADLGHLVTVEIDKSRELMKNLKSCMDFTFKAIKAMNVLQLKLRNFLKRSIKQKGGNLSEDSEVLCNKIENHISAFYAFKSYLQLVGLALGFLCPIEEVQMVGFAVAGGAFAFDWVMDWIASLPENRRIIQKLARKIKGNVGEKETINKQITQSILARAKIMPAL